MTPGQFKKRGFNTFIAGMTEYVSSQFINEEWDRFYGSWLWIETELTDTIGFPVRDQIVYFLKEYLKDNTKGSKKMKFVAWCRIELKKPQQTAIFEDLKKRLEFVQRDYDVRNLEKVK